MSVDVLSLACNIMAVIDSGQKLYQCDRIHTFRDIYENGKPDIIAESNATELLHLADRLMVSQKKAIQSNSIPENSQLSQVADQCTEAATKLREEITRLAPSPSSSRMGRLFRAFQSAIKRNWRHGYVEQLNETLKGCQVLMQTAILVEIHTSGEAKKVTELHHFARLEASVQKFALAVSKHELQMSQLLDIRSLHQETQAVVHNEVTAFRKAQILDADITRLRNSLKSSNLNKRFNGVVSGHDKSFQWLINEDKHGENEHGKDAPDSTRGPGHIQESRKKMFSDFRLWLISEPNSKLYWISGKPGAGKSTLMKSLFEQMSNLKQVECKNAKKESLLVIRYFFWVGTQDERSHLNDLEGMYMSLLHQLLDFEVREGVSVAVMLLEKAPHLRRMDYAADWGYEDLKRATMTVLHNLGNQYSIYILLDALDEHLPAAQHDRLLTVIGELEVLNNVRLIVSSRRERIFEKRLAHARQLQLHTLTASAIHDFALDSLRETVDQAFQDSQDDSAKFLSETVSTIVHKADGVFLWARLAVESVKRGLDADNTPNELRERLEDMPTELSEYFQSIWKRLGDDGRKYQTKAANVFTLLLSYGAFDSNGLPGFDCLSLSLAMSPDIARALICGEDRIRAATLLEMSQSAERTVLSHCAGLVEFELDSAKDALYDSVSRQRRFIHRTARDFFVDTPEGKDLLRTSDIGGDGPDFQLVQALVARSVAFRKPEHTVAPSKALRDIDIYWFFDLLRSLTFTLKQRHALIALVHEVFYQFSGHPDNPLFAEWTIVDSPEGPYHILPFIIKAAFYGFSDYAAQWMKDQTDRGRVFPSRSTTWF